MSTNDQLDTWQTITKPLHDAGFTAYAIIAVDPKDGHVHWGASFPDHQQELIAKLAQITADIKDTAKRRKVNA